MSVVFPAPEAPMRAVSTPGLKAPVMPCHTDNLQLVNLQLVNLQLVNLLEAQTKIYTNTP